MRICLLSLLSLLFLTACASNKKPEAITSVEIIEIMPRYMEAQQFMRIKEYQTGAEHAGDRVIVRTDPKVRDGYYFALLLDTKVHKLPQGTVIVGEFYTATSPEKQEIVFPMPAKRPKTKSVFLGLTGEAWPYAEGEKVPSAWKFTLIDPNEVKLGSQQSYLWEM
ncbi:MAG: hypothetical protein ACPGKS_09720 [Coraliomargarita sp.]